MYCTSVYCIPIVVASGGGGTAGWPPDPPIYTGGGGGPSGGGNCTGTTNCGQLRSLIIAGKVPCCSCGPGPVIVIPIDPPPPTPPNVILNPCADADILETDESFKSYMNELKGLTSVDKEHGYLIFRDPVSNLFANTVHGLIVGPENKLSLGEFRNIYKKDCLAHTHYDSPLADVNGLSIFTPDDLWTWCEAFNAGNYLNASTFTLALVTEDGTQYLLKIQNLTKFQKWAERFTEGSLTVYFDTFKRFGIRADNSSAINEKRFLQYLKLNSGSGLKLFRGNGDFSEWQPLGLDANEDVINSLCQ